MNKDEHIDYWLRGAQDNLEAVLLIYNSKRYDWALYIAHLSIEKLLKAKLINTTNNVVPPKIHNLLKLADLSGVILSDEQKEFLTDLNRFQIEARYPDVKLDLFKIATKEFADEYLKKFKEIFSWLKSQI